MAVTTSKPVGFTATTIGREGTRLYLPIPFDPASNWGKRDRWHVAGTIGGCAYRGVIEPADEGMRVALGPVWCRDNGVKPGDTLEASLALEGPQRDELAPDFAEALAASPEAARFWDSIAQFYRNGYLRWVDATKRRPIERARRIAEVVEMLKAGRKQR